MKAPSDIAAALVEIGHLADADVDLAETALILASIGRPAVHLDIYRRHLATLAEDVGNYVSGVHEPLDVALCHEALVQVIHRRYGYVGQEETFDDPEAANLTYAIDRRSGLPVILGIIYVHVAGQQGWQADGLNFPGRFLVRLEQAGERLIIDPFAGGAVVQPQDLRGILKALSGNHAELKPEYHETVSSRDILLRLQNNIRNRLLRAGRIEEAIDIVEGMLKFAPDASHLWRELGMLHARVDNIRQAIVSLETYLRHDHPGDSRYNASMLLQELRQRLN